MRVLLDTNIVIHREANVVARNDIGLLFGWLDKLKVEKCIHPLSVAEIAKHKDPRVAATFAAKLQSYVELKTIAPESAEIMAIRERDLDLNDSVDTSLLKEVFSGRVDALISEDRGIHRKAKTLNISERVFTIDDFMEKATAEFPELATYKVLAVKSELFGNIELGNPFFDSFRRDYVGFDAWFNGKADHSAYVCSSEAGAPLAFLYVKLEDEREPYADISPPFTAKRRLKIGTLKVAMNGHKLGERFLKIVFDNALVMRAEEIYVTIFRKDPDQERLVALLEDFGFKNHGIKRTASGEESVFVRGLSAIADRASPMSTYPFISRRGKKFIVPIYPQYHTELLPDSILNNEQPADFSDNRPNRNAIRKIYISRSIRRDLSPGDTIIFYRTASGGSGHHTSVATTLGVVESLIDNIGTLEDFVRLCRKRSVFTDPAELEKQWNYKPQYRPFIVNFLYCHPLPRRPNLIALKAAGVIAEAPRGFELISDEAFKSLLEISNANKSLIVD